MAKASLVRSRTASPDHAFDKPPSPKTRLFSLNLSGCIKPSHHLHVANSLRVPSRQSRLEEFREVFRYLDKNGDGKISDAEMRSFFESMGEEDGGEEIAGEEGGLDFGEFVGLMDEGEGRGREEDLRRAFEMFEAEKGSGCITPHGLQRMFSRLGEKRSVHECQTMISSFDLDGDGVLSFHEFLRMMS
ncbi:putative calcium-binding protein [Nymphaea thermarum]|nr:putative calcium-binding protein [Nymphaea thermarum]